MKNISILAMTTVLVDVAAMHKQMAADSTKKLKL